jgi:hypothetical protein
MAILTDVIAQNSYDQASALPQFCGATVRGMSRFFNSCLFVLALNN